MVSLHHLFALATAATLASALPTLHARTTNAEVAFFYDLNCQKPAITVPLPVPSTPGEQEWEGGPYGSRSAYFTTTGSATDWFLKQYTPTRAGPELVYTDQIEKPKLGGCVGFAQGIYAIVTG